MCAPSSQSSVISLWFTDPLDTRAEGSVPLRSFFFSHWFPAGGTQWDQSVRQQSGCDGSFAGEVEGAAGSLESLPWFWSTFRCGPARHLLHSSPPSFPPPPLRLYLTTFHFSPVCIFLPVLFLCSPSFCTHSLWSLECSVSSFL